MKNLFFILSVGLTICWLTSCEEQEELTLAEFYDSYFIGDVYLSVDREIFFDGDAPVKFSATAFDDFENEIKNFDYDIVTNEGDTLDGKTFKPESTSRTTFRAVVNGISSESIKVDYVNTSEIEFIDLAYEGSNFLTTNPWSVTGDFILTTVVDATVFTYDITKSSIPLVISDGTSTIQRTGFKFAEAGSYTVHAEFNGVKSNSFEFTVREENEYEELEFPIVYHCINFSPLVREVDRAIASYNRIFNNTNVTLDKNDLTDQWENPNWINAGMKFKLAEADEEGNKLANPGIHIINTNRIDSEEQLFEVMQNNFWNSNKYINIFLSDEYEFISVSQPFLRGAKLDGLVTRGIDDGGGNDALQYISNGSEPFNSNTMGQFWGLYNTYECKDDYCDDTFSYNVSEKYKAFCVTAGGVLFDCRGQINDGGLYYQARDCSSGGREQEFSLKNIMDDGIDDKEADTTEGGTELTAKRMREFITYDQRERMRTVIENSPFRPTPLNN